MIAKRPFNLLDETMDSKKIAAPPRKGRKMDQVIKGAQEIFARDGFMGASVDDIARAAGVSKATLYSYFPDKRELFVGVWMAECDRFSAEAEARVPEGAAIDEFLMINGLHIVRFMLSEAGRELYRLAIAEISRFPELAQRFQKQGLGQLRDRFARQLRLRAAAGDLRIEDFTLAAEQFVQLTRAGFADRHSLNLVDEITEADVQASVKAAVEMFLARYGV